MLECIRTGSIEVWGRMNHCAPPHLVLPLTVEHTKPRLCHDERFLNLWVRDLPFKLDYLSDLSCCVLEGHFQNVFDDKNGYHHVLLSESSRVFFGFRWLGWYFGFFAFFPLFGKLVHTYIICCVWWLLTLFVLGVSQYRNTLTITWRGSWCELPPLKIKDFKITPTPTSKPGRFYGEDAIGDARYFSLRFLTTQRWRELNTVCYVVEMASFKSARDLLVVGVREGLLDEEEFLFLHDLNVPAFFVPDDKRERFLIFLPSVLGGRCVSQETLQRLAGKLISFSSAQQCPHVNCTPENFSPQ